MTTTLTPDIARALGAEARSRLAGILSRQEWRIREEALVSAYQTVADATLAMWYVDDEEEEEAPEYIVTAEGVAIIPVIGRLVDEEPDWWFSWLGYCSTPHIGRMVAEAHADANITAIALYFKSPGGLVYGIATVQDIIYSVRQAGDKPIVALCEEACSAAYDLACQCERIVVTVDGISGCLGTVTHVRDSSKMWADMGVTIHRITSSGAETYKGAGYPGTPLTDEQQTDLKRVADESNDLFIERIVRGRGISPGEARTLSDGRYYFGANALPLNLVDNVMTVEEAIALLETGAEWPDGSNPPAPEPSPDDSDNDDSTDDDTTAAQRGGKGKPHMAGNNPLTALLRGGGRQPKPAAAPPTTDAADSLTDAEVAAVVEELTALRAFRAEALEGFRADATAAAVRRFGNGTEALQEAQEVIAALESPKSLRAQTSLWRRETPAAIAEPTGARTTTAATVTPTEASAPDKEALAKAEQAAEERAITAAQRSAGVAHIARDNANTANRGGTR